MRAAGSTALYEHCVPRRGRGASIPAGRLAERTDEGRVVEFDAQDEGESSASGRSKRRNLPPNVFGRIGRVGASRGRGVN